MEKNYEEGCSGWRNRVSKAQRDTGAAHEGKRKVAMSTVEWGLEDTGKGDPEKSALKVSLRILDLTHA